MIVTKEESEKMTEQNKKDYCEWCFFKDYGDCNKCALYDTLKTKERIFK